MVAGSEKLSGYADGANRFHDDARSPCSFFPPFSFSSSRVFSLPRFPTSPCSFSFRLVDSSSRLHARARPQESPRRATTKNIGGRVAVGENEREQLSRSSRDEDGKQKCGSFSRCRERRGEVLVISRLSGIACFLESCRSSRPLSISSRIPNLAIPCHKLYHRRKFTYYTCTMPIRRSRRYRHPGCRHDAYFTVSIIITIR